MEVGMTASGDWQPGPVGQGAVPGNDGQLMYLDVAPLRRAVRFVMWSALAGIAGVIALAALIAILIPHELLVAILIALAVPVVLLALGTAALVWVGRRAWRSGAWMELLSIPAGMPWLGRVVWAVRTLLVSRAFWRLGRRIRRPRQRYADAEYQAYQDGPWIQAPVGDLNGTTR
jgi:hypothetical protein